MMAMFSRYRCRLFGHRWMDVAQVYRICCYCSHIEPPEWRARIEAQEAAER
jgi:hypothetical protein